MTYEELKEAAAAGDGVAWMKCREIAKAGSYEIWLAADKRRIEETRPAAEKWVRKVVEELK